MNINLNMITMFGGIISLILLSRISDHKKFSNIASIFLIIGAVCIWILYMIAIMYYDPNNRNIGYFFSRKTTWNTIILCSSIIIWSGMNLVWNRTHSKRLSIIFTVIWIVIVISAFVINNIQVLI